MSLVTTWNFFFFVVVVFAGTFRDIMAVRVWNEEVLSLTTVCCYQVPYQPPRSERGAAVEDYDTSTSLPIRGERPEEHSSRHSFTMRSHWVSRVDRAGCQNT